MSCLLCIQSTVAYGIRALAVKSWGTSHLLHHVNRASQSFAAPPDGGRLVLMGVQLDSWIEKVKRCEYLAEDELKALCEYVRLLP